LQAHILIIAMLVMRFAAIIGPCVTDQYRIIKVQAVATMVDINMTIIVVAATQTIVAAIINFIENLHKKDPKKGAFLFGVTCEHSIFLVKLGGELLKKRIEQN
jgi:hypothetical protein